MFTNSFQELVHDFSPVSVEVAEKLITKQKGTILFIGRETCPYCQRFIPKLHQVVQEEGLTVYFIDSSIPSPALQDFRQRYQATTVPALLFAAADGVQIRCDSSMSEQEIKQFLKG